MLLNRSQFNRFSQNFKRGRFTTIGGVPTDINDYPGWTRSMNVLAGRDVKILNVLVNDPLVMTDGSITYEPLLEIEDPSSGVQSRVKLDWLHPDVINFILREPDPIQVDIKQKAVEAPVSQNEGSWGWLAAGSLAALMGMSYLKKQKVKKQAQQLVDRTPDDFELDVEVVEEEKVQV